MYTLVLVISAQRYLPTYLMVMLPSFSYSHTQQVPARLLFSKRVGNVDDLSGPGVVTIQAAPMLPRSLKWASPDL